jgi:acyl dehydratase
MAMTLPNVYSEAETEMLAAWERAIDAIPGWLDEEPREGKPYPFVHLLATRERLELSAIGNDYWNPLWRDEEYAKRTRWGGIIGHPFFTAYVTFSTPWPELDVPASVGHKVGKVWWEENFFYQPIRVNDSFRVWVMRPELSDATNPDGGKPRIFKLRGAVKIINQRDQVVATRSRTMLVTLLPSLRAWKPPAAAPPYVYSQEDLALIDRLTDQEVVRGREIRFWEDVEVGDQVTPTVNGPLTTWDVVMAVAGVGANTMPMREVRRRTPDALVVDPVTGVSHKEIEIHFSESVAKLVTGQPIVPGFEVMMTRAITNWMGDDAFFRKLDWRMYGVMDLGGTVFARARVSRRYEENGEKLVDLVSWLETIKGNVAAAGIATVRLISRDELKIRL